MRPLIRAVMDFLLLAHQKSKEISGRDYFEYMGCDFISINDASKRLGVDAVRHGIECLRNNDWEQSEFIMCVEGSSKERKRVECETI